LAAARHLETPRPNQRAGCKSRGPDAPRILFSDQRIDLLSTGAPPARRTSPAAVTENLVNGDKTDMVNGTLPGPIVG
jgi:hypothetical protein